MIVADKTQVVHSCTDEKAKKLRIILFISTKTCLTLFYSLLFLITAINKLTAYKKCLLINTFPE